MRELEQCVRSFVVHRDYTPEAEAAPGDLDAVLATLDISGNRLLERYCAALFARTGSLHAVARTMGSHRDTVKARLAKARRTRQ